MVVLAISYIMLSSGPYSLRGLGGRATQHFTESGLSIKNCSPSSLSLALAQLTLEHLCSHFASLLVALEPNEAERLTYLALVLPATNAVHWSSFSASKRIKTSMRSTKGQAGLNNLLISHIGYTKLLK